jgi:hypothetical protein
MATGSKTLAGRKLQAPNLHAPRPSVALACRGKSASCCAWMPNGVRVVSELAFECGRPAGLHALRLSEDCASAATSITLR